MVLEVTSLAPVLTVPATTDKNCTSNDNIDLGTDGAGTGADDTNNGTDSPGTGTGSTGTRYRQY